MSWRERIIIDPAVLAGKPIIKGTHMAVELIIDLLAHDWNNSSISLWTLQKFIRIHCVPTLTKSNDSA